jgi:hypothetical protein
MLCLHPDTKSDLESYIKKIKFHSGLQNTCLINIFVKFTMEQKLVVPKHNLTMHHGTPGLTTIFSTKVVNH